MAPALLAVGESFSWNLRRLNTNRKKCRRRALFEKMFFATCEDESLFSIYPLTIPTDSQSHYPTISLLVEIG
jgi:hypothetical protein